MWGKLSRREYGRDVRLLVHTMSAQATTNLISSDPWNNANDACQPVAKDHDIAMCTDFESAETRSYVRDGQADFLAAANTAQLAARI